MSFLQGKVVLVGDASVGKTAIINYYFQIDSEEKPTIGANSHKSVVKYNSHEVILNIWDTAGQDDFRSLVPMYARNSQVALIVYDQSNKASFDHVPGWINFLKDNVNIPHIFLVGNKSDLDENVQSTDALQIADDNDFRYIRTSAKSGDGINELFCQIAEVVYESGDGENGSFMKKESEAPAENSSCC